MTRDGTNHELHNILTKVVPSHIITKLIGRACEFKTRSDEFSRVYSLSDWRFACLVPILPHQH